MVSKNTQPGLDQSPNIVHNKLIAGIRNAVSFSPLVDKSDQDRKAVEASLNNIIRNTDGRTGEESVNFLNMLYGESNGKQRRGSGVAEQERKKLLVKLNDLIEGGEYASIINDVFFSEAERFTLIEDYDKITQLIPEVGIIVDTYVESIISPESFDNRIIQYSYSDAEYKETVETKIGQIIKEHKLNMEIREIISERIRRGQSYVAVINMDDFITTALKESTFSDIYTSASPLYESSSNDLPEVVELKESFTEFFRASNKTKVFVNFDDSFNTLTESQQDNSNGNNLLLEALEDYTNTINYDLNLRYLQEAEEQPEGKFTETITKDKKKEKDTKENNRSERDGPKQYTTNEIYEHIKGFTQDRIAVTDHKSLLKRKGKVISGTIVYRLDARRLVPIMTENDICLGYYYIDYDHTKTFGNFSSTNRGMSPSVYSDMISTSTFTSNGIESLVDAKTKLISNILTAQLAKKLDRNFIADNPQFKEVIFGLLKNDKRMKKVMSVSYIPPEAVITFGKPNDSVLKNVLFLCRLYLACLLSNFMQRIIQGSDKRVIYVDMGLDKDIPGAINRFARNMKTKEFKASHINDINTVFQRVSTNQDIFIPTKGGSKPIDIEMMPSREINYNDDFLNILKTMIFTGSGLPNELLAGAEAIDFAQSLQMRNARYLRKIIPMSSEESENLTNLILRILDSDLRSSERSKIATSTSNSNKNAGSDEQNILKNINLDKLKIGFAMPVSLMAQAYSDKIGTFDVYATFVAKTVTGKEDTDPEVIALKREIIKKHMNDIDWVEIEKMYTDVVQRKLKEDKIKAGSAGGGDPGMDDTGNDMNY